MDKTIEYILTGEHRSAREGEHFVTMRCSVDHADFDFVYQQMPIVIQKLIIPRNALFEEMVEITKIVTETHDCMTDLLGVRQDDGTLSFYKCGKCLKCKADALYTKIKDAGLVVE